MPFTRVGGISHVIGGGDCPRRHNSRTILPGVLWDAGRQGGPCGSPFFIGAEGR